MNRTINTALLWTNQKTNQAELLGVFTFNWRKLDNWNTIRVISSNHDDLWTIDFKTYDTPLEDGGGVLWKYYRKKTINIVLSVHSETMDWLNELIDEIKYRTSMTEWILQISINGVLRERTATCTSLKFNRQSYNVNRVWNVMLTFTCVNPHSRLETPIAEDFIMQTWTYTNSILYEWKAESFPKIYINIDSWSSEWISFVLNWYTINVESEINIWDIIEFDWETKSVRINHIEKEYSWPFTSMKNWENTFSISCDATYTWTLSFYKNFL